MSENSPCSRYEHLQCLFYLLVQERETAKSLDIAGMEAATWAMQELLSVLEADTSSLSADETRLVGSIQREVKRNAHFFQQALAWVEESAQVVRGNTDPPGYSPQGDLSRIPREGRLLSGRI